ncbi:sulfotransferase [Parahaliea sp. F7430]|uniref:Sulfotransferase n=1 Tax=Sediminihaliea albiluteola TaxID=2758564 RepID=A0A7W2TVG7_9GAMM|nr:sulfotransferase [Sediminihaliea albiluteola]MBA6412688.1 sulfotransferase [Sediminihaliea albiluteola]
MIDSALRHSHLFIAGTHRSGTSLIHEILREHPAISGFRDTPAYMEDEGQFLQSVYPRGEEFGGPGRFAFESSAHMTETHPLVSADNAQRLFGEWSQYWDLRKPILVEKSPPNIIRTRFLQALFPNSHFLIILRHPVAVAYATQKWSKTSINSLIDHTLRAYEIFFEDRSYLANCHLVYYEDFVERPQEIVDQIFEFLGLEKQNLDREISPLVNQRYFESWRNDRRKFWRPVPRRVSPELELCANRVGYSLKGECKLPETAHLE